MIEYTLDKKTSILQVRPIGPLTQEDFADLAEEVDPFIVKSGSLAGLILEFKKFPGWENLGSAIRHFRFVSDHHKKVRKIAVVTDSPIGTVAEHISSHFVSAQIRHFDSDQMALAKQWIADG